jgi:hypothetical protein
MIEEWKTVVGDYKISNFGNCMRGDKPIKGCKNGSGYKFFQFYDGSKKSNYIFHIWVAKLFIGERPDGLVIDHIDRDKLNNHVSNLRYVTQSENVRNSSIWRDDIATTEKRERLRIFEKESRIRTGRFKNLIAKKGSGSLRQTKNGKWRICIILDKVRYDNTLNTVEEAIRWRDCIISNSLISTI